MPTPGERRALIFIASVAALGVAVRGVAWSFNPQDPSALAGNRTALARQIEAVDSAIFRHKLETKAARKQRTDTARTKAPLARITHSRQTTVRESH